MPKKAKRLSLSPNIRLTVRKSMKQKFEKVSCLKGYIRKEFLGKGAWGQVFVACKKTKCKYAIKLTAIGDPSHLVYATKDAYFLKLLEKGKLHGKRVVPRVKEFWYCPKQYCFDKICKSLNLEKERGISVLVSEKFDKLNLQKKASQLAIDLDLTYEKGKNVNEKILAYREYELKRMYEICIYLGLKGVIWSDCKPDQFLVKASKKLVVANDFGFAGTLDQIPYEAEEGWCSNDKAPPEFGACPNFMIRKHIKTPEDAVLYNVWQLEAWLVGGGPEYLSFVTKENHSKYKRKLIKALKLFTGLRFEGSWLKHWNHLIQSVCPTFAKTYQEVIENWNEKYSKEHQYTLNFNDLYRNVKKSMSK